jgi:peroxiredoxin
VTLACAATLLGFRLSGLCDEWVMVTPTHPQTQASIGSGEHSGSSRPQPAAEMTKAIDFNLPDLEGRSVSLHKWRGRPVLVYFWATWCPHCGAQVEELNAIYARGMMVVGVAEDREGAMAVAPFVEQHAIRYPELLADAATLERLGLRGVPQALLLDANGRLVERVEGEGPRGSLSAVAEQLARR